MRTPPCPLCTVLRPFAPLFSPPVFKNAGVLAIGAILAPGRRTVAAALRVMGLAHERGFKSYHRVLSRALRCSRRAGQILLQQLLTTFAPQGPLVFGLDDTIERRWGAKIQARGMYRDPVRSSHGHFVKASGLRWLSLMLLVPVPWAGRVWALPFLTVLCPSERYAQRTGKCHKTLLDWARQSILQLRRWIPDREIIVVGDNTYAALEWLVGVREHATAITRFRLDARLYETPPPRKPGTMGRLRKRGARLPTLGEVLASPATQWIRVQVPAWYGNGERDLEITTGTAMWFHGGVPVVPLRWVLVRDPEGKLDPKAFLCTDQAMDPVEILRLFVRRWQVEVTYAEVRRHLGVETQRQWSDLAIARTTPCLIGLFSIVTLVADRLYAQGDIAVRRASWYEKPLPTFSDALAVVRRQLWDALAVVRRQLWRETTLFTSDSVADVVKFPREVLDRLTDTLAYAA